MAYLDQTSELGGAEIALTNLLTMLDRARWDPVACLGNAGPLLNRLISNAVPVDVLPLPRVLTDVRQGALSSRILLNPLRLAFAIRYGAQLAQLLRRRGVGLIHANSLRVCVLGGIAGRLARIPVVWHIHSVVAEPMMSRQAVRWFRSLAGWLPAHVICNSSTTAACFDLPADKLTVVPCGVSPDHFRPSTEMRPGRQRVGMASRFAPIKGQHIFLQAVERLGPKHPSAEFIVAGAPMFGQAGYAQQIHELAHAGSAFARLHFPGFIDDVPNFFRGLDVVAFPSLSPEGFGQVVVEAMMCGKPVVVSSAGASAELIEDGVTGLLVSPGDPDALAEAIDNLLTEPEKAAEMGRRAREVALERYDIRKTTRAIEDIYERVLARA